MLVSVRILGSASCQVASNVDVFSWTSYSDIDQDDQGVNHWTMTLLMGASPARWSRWCTAAWAAPDAAAAGWSPQGAVARCCYAAPLCRCRHRPCGSASLTALLLVLEVVEAGAAAALIRADLLVEARQLPKPLAQIWAAVLLSPPTLFFPTVVPTQEL
ncbi:hypothetical protein Dimus_029530 [Dionaea muscipula]